MGDYSAVCAVTGLPITNSQKVIGLELEPFRFESTRSRFVPKSWVVEGEYDMGGGIEGHNLSPNVALVHKEVWENAEMYWHSENKKSNHHFFNVPEKLKKAKEGFEKEYHHDYWTLNDYVYYEIYSAGGSANTTDEALTLRELLDSKNDNVTGLPADQSYIHRSAFGQILTERMIAGWTEQDDITLYRLVCLYSGQMITGKQIAPSNQPYIEQYPTYKQRIKVLAFATKLARKLNKKN